MNKCMFMGRLTRDPEIRSNEKTSIARYTIAVERRRKAEDGSRESDFIDLVCFGPQADFAEKYLHKGTRMLVTARAQSGSYENAEGKKVYRTDFVVEDQEFAESKRQTSAADDVDPME